MTFQIVEELDAVNLDLTRYSYDNNILSIDFDFVHNVGKKIINVSYID